MSKQRYAIITIDAEAQPKRASGHHVQRLIWGQHDQGTAGVAEMCQIADSVGAKLTFFVDACGVYLHGEPFADAVRWLVKQGHDVQLHTHSEFLPEAFWDEHGFKLRPRMLNDYDDARALFTLDYFSDYLAQITGKPIQAFRAGSFRWSAATLKAQAELGIPMSFNHSYQAYQAGACPYAHTWNRPFVWSNGIIEVPVTERRLPRIGVRPWYSRLAFPSYVQRRNPPWKVLWPYMLGRDVEVMVVLLHSWSLLYWDNHGYGVYRDDHRLEDFEKLMKWIARSRDIITTEDFLSLHQQSLITTPDTVDISVIPGSRS